MPTQFVFHSDPSHGWLQVTRDALADVGLTLAQISRYSYRNDLFLFLEEDRDAPLFLQAYEAKHGHAPTIVEGYPCAASRIRRMTRING